VPIELWVRKSVSRPIKHSGKKKSNIRHPITTSLKGGEGGCSLSETNDYMHKTKELCIYIYIISPHIFDWLKVEGIVRFIFGS
jgi:hypothetical protein